MKIGKRGKEPVTASHGQLCGAWGGVEHARDHWNTGCVLAEKFEQLPLRGDERERCDHELKESLAQGKNGGEIVGQRSRAADQADSLVVHAAQETAHHVQPGRNREKSVLAFAN